MYRVGHCHRRGGCSGGAGRGGGRYADELCVDISLLWRGYVTDAYLGGGNMSGPGGGLIMSALVALHCYGGGGWLGWLGWLGSL